MGEGGWKDAETWGHGDGERERGGIVRSSVVNHNRDLKSKREDRQEITIESHDGEE